MHASVLEHLLTEGGPPRISGGTVLCDAAGQAAYTLQLGLEGPTVPYEKYDMHVVLLSELWQRPPFSATEQRDAFRSVLNGAHSTTTGQTIDHLVAARPQRLSPLIVQ